MSWNRWSSASTIGRSGRRRRDTDRVRVDAGAVPADESLFKGLPDDRCQCDHWGYLFSGSFRVTYLDGTEEIVRAGEAYHLRPGHFVRTLEPVELIELSPVEDHDRTMETIARNLGALPA